MSDGILRKTGSYYVDEIGELQRQLTAAKAEIEQLRAELGEKKRDLHHWWKRGLDAECLVEEMEAEAAERGGDNEPA